jgi:hypothetical protein
MITESEFVSKLASSLRNELNPDFVISTAFGSASIEGFFSNVRPDIVISRGDEKRPIIIEVKTAGADRQLPLATAHTTQALKAANMGMNPEIFLVTSSRVSSLLREELVSQDVEIFDEPQFDKLIEKLVYSIKRL